MMMLGLLQVFFKVLSVFCLFVLEHFLLFPFLYAFLVALHDDGDEHILDGSIEENHEENEVNLSGESFGPSLQKGVVHNISVEE